MISPLFFCKNIRTTQTGLVHSFGLCIFLLVVFACSPSLGWANDVFDSSLQARGMIISDLRTTLSAEISATVQVLSVDMGQSFSNGQTLVQFDADLYRAQLHKAQAELQSAQQLFAANKKLHELKSIGELDLLQSKSLVEQKQSELTLYQIQLHNCTVTAPFAGRVLERKVNPHQYVTQGTPLLDIIDDKNLSVQAFVPSSWVAWLKVGQSFVVNVDEIGTSYSARVNAIGSAVDANSQTLELRAAIAEPHPGLLAGMSGAIIFANPSVTKAGNNGE